MPARATDGASTPDAHDGSPMSSLLTLVQPVRDEFVRDLFEKSVRDISELHDLDHRLRQLLYASIEENVITALHVLEHDIDPHSLDAPPSAITYAQRLAQHDVPLSALLRNYRIGLADFLQLGVMLARQLPGGNDPDLLMALVQRASAYVDEVCEQVGDAYERERERWVQRRGALLSQRVKQLIEDPRVDPAEVELALGYRLDQLHVAAIVWADHDDGMTAVGSFDGLATRLGRLVGATAAPLVVPADEREAWLWLPASTDRGEGVPVSAGDLVAALGDAAGALRVAAGTALPGIEGFRDSHLQAQRVKSVAVQAATMGHVALSFAELGPVAMLADDVPALRSWVTQVLGPLAEDGERESWLRDSLRVFLECDGSYAAAAERLQLHRNTVQYRVQQAEDVRGRPVGSDRMQVQLALTAARWLGHVVLSGLTTSASATARSTAQRQPSR